jgi:hypothetical protein
MLPARAAVASKGDSSEGRGDDTSVGLGASRSALDARFSSVPPPPIAHGASPFRARGIIFRADLERVERQIPGGAPAVARAIGDAALEKFFSQHFALGGWYDMLPLLALGKAVARMRGIPFSQYARESAHGHAEYALRGFSGIVLRSISPETIAVWMPRITGWYHDFGDISVRAVGPGHVRGVRTGIPEALIFGWSVSSMEFTEEVLRRCGASDARASALGAEEEGMRAGSKVFRLAFDVRWTDRAR